MSGQHPFRILKILSSGIITLLLSFQLLHAQAIIGVVDYMKVDNPQEYLEVEKSWKKIHELRLKKDMIMAWSVFKVMFKTTEDPYNYITVSWYDSFSKLDKGVPESILNEAFPEKSEEEWEKFHELTESSRKLVTQGVFHARLRTSLENQTSSKKTLKIEGEYIVINEINVAKGKSKNYINLLEEIYLPIYKEDINQGNRVTWSLWEKWPGNLKDFQYLVADAYTSLDQIEPIDFLQYFREIHPEKDIDEISKQIEEMRELVNSEMWKLIYLVDCRSIKCD